MSEEKTVIIYTDGACSGNPGPGGWGAVMMYGNARKEIAGGESATTNNRMELMAVIASLRTLKRSCQVIVYTDSKYVMDGVTRWLQGWKEKGWKTAAKKPVKNADLWQELDEELRKHHVSWQWVKGHNGDIENERADTLARSAIPSP